VINVTTAERSKPKEKPTSTIDSEKRQQARARGAAQGSAQARQEWPRTTPGNQPWRMFRTIATDKWALAVAIWTLPLSGWNFKRG